MPGIVILGGDFPSTWTIANALVAEAPVTVVLERPEPRLRQLRRRARRLGLAAAAGQVLFMLYGGIAGRRCAARRRAVMAAAGLDETRPEDMPIHRVGSANGAPARALLQALAPDAVVVSGTRILSRAMLDALSCPVLNVHSGITPAYRGVHGGYWALASGDAANCGVTVHLVDTGIDTGEVVAQARIEPGPGDTFFTYPALQLAAAVPLLRAAVRAALDGSLRARAAEGASRQWYHPTLWGYLATGLSRGVW